LISAIGGYGVSQDVLVVNPAIGVTRAKEHGRERVLSNNELQTVWPELNDTLRFVLLTGARKNEVEALDWSEIDLPRKLWTLPPARAKNSTGHTVPLVGEALRILEKRAQSSTTDRVFPGRIEDAHNDARAAVAFTENWTIHDLRRTAATGLGKLGYGTLLKRLLNHSEGNNVTGRYDRHTYNQEKHKALRDWDREVARIVKGKTADVIDISTARA
jgi:integrase